MTNGPVLIASPIFQLHISHLDKDNLELLLLVGFPLYQNASVSNISCKTFEITSDNFVMLFFLIWLTFT